MDFEQLYPGMWEYPTNPDLCCIYRVPNNIREVNPQAYTPQLVLIGPLHHSLKSQARQSLGRGDITCPKSMGYLNMEKHKKIYLAAFAQRFNGEKTIIDGLRRMIEEEEETIRANYQESTAWIQSQEFVEMVMQDSVFIIEFILRVCETRGETKKTGDPLMDEKSSFILEKLFDPIVPIIFPQHTLRNIIISFFSLKGKVGDNSKFSHFTDLFRCVYVETFPKREEKRYSGGVKFKAVGNDFSLCVTFENGCLMMPCLKVYYNLEMELRNIMALEQCHYSFNAYVCNYFVFLDRLIDTDKDVDLLVEKGIIKNWMGQPALLARMMNKLGLGIIEYNSYYWDIEAEVKAYYSNPMNKSKAILKRVYFGNLWTGTATIAATLLLVMTLIQTWASVTQVKQN
ncbi:hypothetical protein N665_0297s0008 [Sinapis alba]|nr:hypothetical protein N665_0297s0008 [Sinapis alba]